MKKAQLEQKQKPRAVSDSSAKKQTHNQDQSQSKARSFTDLFSVFSKKQKVSKRDASTNTTPDETYAQPTAPPALPPKINHYYLNETLNKVEVTHEDVYNEVNLEGSMNVEPGTLMSTDKETMTEEDEDDSDSDSDEDSDADSEDVLDKGPKIPSTHKRNTSGWSLGSFHIGTPVELMNDLLTGDAWANLFEDHLKYSPVTIVSVADEANRDTSDVESKYEEPKDAVDGKPLEDKTQPIMDSNIDDIMKSVKIIEKKVETPKVPEEPAPPHVLPPKLTPTFSAGINKQFRSSVFYKYSLPPLPPGQKPPPETPKSGALILDKIRAKLRKSSVDESSLKESEK